MPYTIRPLGCDPARVKGMSERLIVSHYENNCCGAVKRLNLIEGSRQVHRILGLGSRSLRRVR